MLICKPLPFFLIETVPRIFSSLADRDMFMRFRGGGIGHLYMRQVEPWLDSTGWGTSWPSLSSRDPTPDLAQAPHRQPGIDDDEPEGGSDSDEEDDEDSEDEKGRSEQVEDGDGNDEEQDDDDEDEDESEEDKTTQQTPGYQTRSKGSGDQESEEEGVESSS